MAYRALRARIRWRTNREKCYSDSMSTMISEVYDELNEEGASEEKARKAAEAVATMKIASRGLRAI